MCPFSQADGTDNAGECDEVVPHVTGSIDDVVHIIEDGVGQHVGAEELPDVFDRVQFGSTRWQEDQADVARQSEFGGRMPWRPVEQHDGMGSPGHGARNLFDVQLDTVRADKRENEACGHATWSTDCPEQSDVGIVG